MICLDRIREAIDHAVQPAQFFAGRSLGLEWGHLPREESSWEIYHGRLLDPAHSRARRTFESWNVWQRDDAAGRSAQPLLSVKLDAEAGQVHVVRAILSHGWEAFDAGGNVIDSRPVQKWVRELVGTIELDEAADLEAELAELLFQAVVGCSRLALTSIEAPLPAFTLGQLGYCWRREATGGPLRSAGELIERLAMEHDGTRRTKLLELWLRAVPADDILAHASAPSLGGFALAEDSRAPSFQLKELLLSVFNNVSLSPYTNFVDKSLALARQLPAAEHIDFLATLLRRLTRHLTAFDLVRFHHRGANYPDALLLDALLKEHLQQIDRCPEQFNERLRRRSLRQAWLIRRRYEGHPVPDVPTSEGENVRVLPAAFPRVPEEQIHDPKRWQRRLFADDPLDAYLTESGRVVLELSLTDLDHPAELRELGTALFLDRPLGVFKRPGEPDRTVLLSYVAFSRSLAKRRLGELARLGLLTQGRKGSLHERLDCLEVRGIALEPQPLSPRPGTASLHDACQVAGDFVLLHTTPRSAADFLGQWDLSRWGITPGQPWLIVGGAVLPGRGPGSLTIFDAADRPRLELAFDPRAGMACRDGRESPARGLQIVRLWDREEREVSITVPPVTSPKR